MLTLKEQLEHSTGTYFSIEPSIQSKMLIHAVMTEYGIKNQIPLNKLHTTIIYSKKPCPDMRYYQPKLPVWGVANRFELFGTKVGTKCLVLLVSSPEIEELYNKLQQYEPTTDFPNYRAHMSLSYDFDGECPVLKDIIPLCYNNHTCVAIED
jgi:hypothetical protein